MPDPRYTTLRPKWRNTMGAVDPELVLNDDLKYDVIMPKPRMIGGHSDSRRDVDPGWNAPFELKRYQAREHGRKSRINIFE